MKIEYSNLKCLSDADQIKLKSVIEGGYKKLSKQISGNTSLQVRVKVSDKGKAKRYSLYLSMNAENKIFKTKNSDSEKYGDYDITKAAHKIINHLTNEISKGLRNDVPEWKKHNIKKLFNRFF